jgi:hypothetical protein
MMRSVTVMLVAPSLPPAAETTLVRNMGGGGSGKDGNGGTVEGAEAGCERNKYWFSGGQGCWCLELESLTR